MCLADYKGREEDTCASATAYKVACYEIGIPVKIPRYCVK